jgi:hypothetical protein
MRISVSDSALARQVISCNACFKSLTLQRAGISLPQSFTVGSRYTNGGVALLGINPGAGAEGAYKEARRVALDRFASGNDAAIGEYWDSLAQDSQNFWNKKHLARVRSLGLQIESLLIGNIALCATAGNKYPKAMLRNCWSRHTEGFLKHYVPGVLVLMGSEGTVGEFLRKVKVTLPSLRAIRIAHYAHREGAAHEQAECARVRKFLGTSDARVSA